MIKEFFPKLWAENKRLDEIADKTSYITWRDGYKQFGLTKEDLELDLRHPYNVFPRRMESVRRWIDSERKLAYGNWADFQKTNDLPIKLKAGTILEVDRIYIRKGAEDFSSVTFKIRGNKVLRFWAKLQDVNNIQCVVVE